MSSEYRGFLYVPIFCWKYREPNPFIDLFPCLVESRAPLEHLSGPTEPLHENVACIERVLHDLSVK